jgi:hypothetical protein
MAIACEYQGLVVLEKSKIVERRRTLMLTVVCLFPEPPETRGVWFRWVTETLVG